MVLESLLSPYKAEQAPSKLILLGFLYCVVAIFLASWVFSGEASLVFVFLTVMAAVPLMFNVIKEEEKKDVSNFREIVLLKEHTKALKAFMALFLGITLGVVAVYVLAPLAIAIAAFSATMLILSDEYVAELLSEKVLHKSTIIGISLAIAALVALISWSTTPDLVSVFELQETTIQQINGRVTGGATTSGTNIFAKIFFNNMKVLVFCILFSFLYGSGAIFVLTWNASVIGTAVGNFIRTNLAQVSDLVGFQKSFEYFNIVSIGLFKYIIHGVPEILGYFVAALAGGIISVGVIKHDFKGKKFEHIILDATDLILLAVGIIFVAAVLEVWVTPVFF